MIRLGAGRARVGHSPRLVRNAQSIPGFWAGYDQSFTLTNDAVDAWHEITGDATKDLSPATTSPDSMDYRLSGLRSPSTGKELDLPAEKSFSPPYEFWLVFDVDDLTAAQRLLQSDDNGDGRFVVNNSGSLRLRVNTINLDITPTSIISAKTIYLVGVMCDALGNITCEVNGTTYDESVSSAAPFKFHHTGYDTGSSATYLGGMYFFEAALTESQRRVVRQQLKKYTSGTIAPIGASNTWDISQGCDVINYQRLFHSYSNYNSKPMKEWFDQIGFPANQPWANFIGQAGTHTHISAIFLHVMISPANMGASEATMQSWLTAILQEARDQLDSAGHDGANMPCYVTPLATYPDPSVDCASMSSGANQRSNDLVDWAAGGGLTNCFRGPNLPPITFARADDGDPTSPCHVDEPHKADDAWAMRNFFGE